MEEQNGFIDTWLMKLTSRKLLVWLTASALAFGGYLASADWVIISSIFIGTQGVVDVGGPASGMLNQGQGMIGAADMFGTDRMPMDAVSVNARHTA